MERYGAYSILFQILSQTKKERKSKGYKNSMEWEPLEREAVSLASSYRHERGEVLMGSGEMRFIFKI